MKILFGAVIDVCTVIKQLISYFPHFVILSN
jgi:hypothetical protein